MYQIIDIRWYIIINSNMLITPCGLLHRLSSHSLIIIHQRNSSHVSIDMIIQIRWQTSIGVQNITKSVEFQQ